MAGVDRRLIEWGEVAFEIDGPDHDNAGLHAGLAAFVARFEEESH